MHLDITSSHDVVIAIRTMHASGLRITVHHIHKYMNAVNSKESHMACFEALSEIENGIRARNLDEITRMDNIAPKGLCFEYHKMKYYRDPIIAKLHKKYFYERWEESFKKIPINTEKSIEFIKTFIK